MSHSPVRQRTDPKARLIASEGLRPTIAPSRRGVRYHASANAPYDARVSIREAPFLDTAVVRQAMSDFRVRYHAIASDLVVIEAPVEDALSRVIRICPWAVSRSAR